MHRKAISQNRKTAVDVSARGVCRYVCGFSDDIAQLLPLLQCAIFFLISGIGPRFPKSFKMVI